MSIQKNQTELTNHKSSSIQILDDYLSSLISSDDPKIRGKADKLCYWLKDWVTFLEFENKFSPMSLRRYKRGEIIKVHLGFNIGSEEGGLHYAVVLDKNNAKSSPIVTILPLTSVKPHTDLSNLRSGSIFLGNELYTSLSSKVSAASKHFEDEIRLLNALLSKLEVQYTTEELALASQKLTDCQTELDFLSKMRSEIQKMRVGSIALVNQITTISKLRIYDPKTDHDVLSGIRLSNEKLNLIDEEIKKKFTNI